MKAFKSKADVLIEILNFSQALVGLLLMSVFTYVKLGAVQYLVLGYMAALLLCAVGLGRLFIDRETTRLLHYYRKQNNDTRRM